MVDLTTTYLGLKLKNPLVASASPLSEKVDNVRRLEDSGVSAVVMYSLFEEQILRESLQLDHFLNFGTESFAEAATHFPEMGHFTLEPDLYVDRLHSIRQAVSIPVIGSLNGVSTGGWIEYARKIEQAGANALELNLYYLPTDPDLTSAELEDTYVQLVSDVHNSIKIPLAVKLSPFFTTLPNLGRRLVKAGAKGLVLFNRFYQPDFDLEELTVVPNLQLSTSSDLRLPLRWVALLYGRIPADFAITSGVHTPEDMIKSIMAGASVTMVASELLSKGIGRATEMIAGFQNWMEEKEYQSTMQMKGSMSQQAIADPAAIERSNYMKVLNSYQS
jgi:dihydroorotate dehydrogenase (fumarate)